MGWGWSIPNLVELLGGNDYVAPELPAPPLNDAHTGGFFMPGVSPAVHPIQQTSVKPARPVSFALSHAA